MRSLRLVISAFIVMGFVAMSAAFGVGTANADTVDPTDPGVIACAANLQTPPTTNGTLVKSLSSFVDNGDGTFTVLFTFTSSRAAGTYNLGDCAFVETNANSAYNPPGDTIAGYTVQHPIFLLTGTNTGTITFFANPGDTVCDQLNLTKTSPAVDDKSNIACLQLGDAPVPSNGALGAVGIIALSSLAFGAAYAVNRRSTKVAPMHVA